MEICFAFQNAKLSPFRDFRQPGSADHMASSPNLTGARAVAEETLGVNLRVPKIAGIHANLYQCPK